jgi:hypothetical protein
MPTQKRISAQHTTKAAALNSVAPPPGGNTLPTAISSTSAGSILLLSISALNAPTSRSDAGVSLNPPFPPFVNAVRRHAVTTICRKPSSAHCPDNLIKRMEEGRDLHHLDSSAITSLLQRKHLPPWAQCCSSTPRGGQRPGLDGFGLHIASHVSLALYPHLTPLHTHLQTFYAISILSFKDSELRSEVEESESREKKE